VMATGCTFRECDIGISSQRGAGSIKGCWFQENDTGIAVTDALSTLYIGGAGADINEFWTSPGDGIHLGSGAKATVGANTFQNVAGTAIHVESGNATVSIQGCGMDGSGGCFQGIRTRGQGTMATIRGCTIQGYSSPVVPLPRAVAVTDLFMTGPTADLGTVAPNSPGTNAFSQNTTDLFYGPSIGQPGQNPVPIYAQLNYWGENPPAAQSFGGSWSGAIVYDPWLPQPPAPAPRLPEDEALPTGLVVEAVRPNPARETATIVLSLPAAGHAEVAVFDMQGRLMKTLLNEERPAGRALVEWDGTDESGRPLGAGVYLWKVRSVSGTAAGTLVLIR
ncbi:right-handed parallel beta-helix repeat-containing protein, partial [Candidatus Fermentibacteria bacterium]|nr:right-handed parallel beta-helix repeat-containing protein [Candidatus Fermentibacteria bacterium]